MKGWKNNDIYLKVITKIYSATGWIEACSVLEARADLVAYQVELSWLSIYPCLIKL